MVSAKGRGGPEAIGRRPAGRARIAALVILLVAFGLRVWRLGSQSFWWDEAYSTMVAREGWGEIIATLAREDFHPPLHYFLLHLWLRLVGSSEFALRYSSVLAGVLVVAAAWTTARRFFGRSAALAAAVIFSLAPFLWYYTRETRMFALIPLFTVLTLYFCARAVESGRWRWWAAYAAGVTLGLYDLYYALFLPFACGAWVLLRRWRGEPRDRLLVRGWALATLAALVMYLPWVPIFLARSRVWSSAFPPDNGPIKVVLWSWVSFVLGLPTLELYRDPLPLALLGGTLLALGFAFGWAGWAWRRSPAALLTAIAFLGPLMVMAAISLVKPVFHPRYAMPAAPGLYLLLAGFWGTLVSRRPLAERSPHPSPRAGEAEGRASSAPWLDAAGAGADRPADPSTGVPWSTALRWVAALGLAAVLGAAFAFGLDQLNANPTYTRDDYRGAIAYVTAHAEPADVIIHNAIPPFAYYDHGKVPAVYVPSRPYRVENIVAELNEVTADRKRLWSVMNITIPSDPDQMIDAQLRLHAQKLEERWYGPIRVQLWQIPSNHAFATAELRRLAINLADQFTLTGYSLAGDRIGGQSLDIGLTVQTQAQPAADDGFWVALVDADGRTWGRGDARPHDAAYQPTSAWEPGTSIALRLDLPILIGTPPGEYRLVAGAYRLRDLAGLDVLDADGHAIGQQTDLGRVTIDRIATGTGDPTLANQRRLALGDGLVLLADQIEADTVLPGDVIPVTLLWTTVAPLESTGVRLRLRTMDGATIDVNEDPLGQGLDPKRWPIGGVIREQRRLTVPPDAASGSARLTLETAAGRSVDLGTVAIAGVKRDFQPPVSGHPLDVSFEGIIGLIGYDLSSATARAGETLTVTLDWRALHPNATSYRVFVHLLDPSKRVLSQWDGIPRDWAYPTSAWLPGEYVRDQYALPVPSAAPPGVLTLEVGWYDAASGKRLTTERADGTMEDRVILQTIRIEP